MKSQLYYWLSAESFEEPCVYFRENGLVELAIQELMSDGAAVFEIDGASIHSMEDLFRAFAIALKIRRARKRRVRYK